MQMFGTRSSPHLNGFPSLLWILALIPFLYPHSGKTGEVLDAVVASVNGKPILLSDLKRAQSERAILFPAEATDLSAIREQLIEDMLIESYATQQNIRITDEELEREIENLAEQRKMKKSDYLRLVEENGIRVQTYRRFLRGQLLRTRLIQREILPWITADEADLLAYRKAHPDRFRTPPEVEFSFVLLEKESLPRLLPECARVEDCFSKTLPPSSSEKILHLAKRITIPLDEIPEEIRMWIGAPLPQGAMRLIPDPSGRIRIYIFIQRIPPQDLPMEKIRKELEEAVRREKLELFYIRWIEELKKNAIIERFPIPGS